MPSKNSIVWHRAHETQDSYSSWDYFVSGSSCSSPRLTLFDSDVKVQLCKQPTNGISYFTALLDFSQLPADLNIYVPLFCSVLTEVGAGDLSYRDFAQQTELCAGEFSSSTSLVVNHSDVSQFKRSALLRSFSLERNTDKMFELWTKLFNEPKLEDKDRLKTLILNVRW